MEIEIKGIKKTYRITSDGLQFILSEKGIRGKKSKTPGEPYFSEIGYWPKLEMMVDRLMMLEFTDSELNSLKDLQVEIVMFRSWVEDWITNAIPSADPVES